MKLNTLSITGIIAGLSGLAIMLFTDPDNISVGVLLLPPLLLFYAGFVAIYKVLGNFALFKSGTYKARRGLYSAMLSGFPIMLLVLQSVNQLTAKDVALFGTLVALLGFYASRFKLKTIN